jgi:serine/threonine-protein kinase
MIRIGDYDLLYRLGTGGMGNVYLARRRNESGLQRLFAVKVMHAVLSADAEFANMFLDEAHIASQLHHINVVGIVDLGRYEGRLFLVMDYVEGPTLAHLMSATAATAARHPALVCSIVIDMLHGLHAAHSLINEDGERLELVHRDVSPSNILVGTDGVARLTDFGIAKARMRRTSTSPGIRKGKLSYSAPEQITNPGSEDARVDVFAAGVVLWNALTGSRLFGGGNEASVILSVISRPIPPPSQMGLRPPTCLDRVCLRALSRDPAHRYPSAAEMAEDLRRVTRANDMVVGPEHASAWVAQQFGEELVRRRAAIRESAATDAGSLAAAARSPALAARSPAPDRDDEYVEISVSSGDAGSTALQPRPRARRSLALGALSLAVCMTAAGAGFMAYSHDANEPARPSAVAPAPESPPPQEISAPQVAEAIPVVTSIVAPAANVVMEPSAPPATAVVDAVQPGAARVPESVVQEARSQIASKPRGRRRPAPAVRRRAPARVEANISAPEPRAQQRSTSETSRPAAAEMIETNPYLRRSGRKSR